MRAMLLITICGLVWLSSAETGCINACSHHGVCVSNECHCFDGFGGPACDSVTNNCPNQCSGRGKCLDGVCDCDADFAGADCSVVSESCAHLHNCTGHGLCVGGVCHCDHEWQGDSCDQFVMTPCPAHLNHCSDHGQCGAWRGASSNLTCKCDVGFCGERCDRVCSQCPGNCSGHGICAEFRCVCQVGFGGPDCLSVIATPECPNFCSGHGRCVGTQCECDDNWTGEDCNTISPEHELCPNMCSEQGACESGVCHCNPAFTGVACDQLVQCPNNCSAHGDCVHGNCTCSDEFTGPDCSLSCHTGGTFLGCAGNGKCMLENNAPKCFCHTGFAGVGCQIKTSDNAANDLDSMADGSPVAIGLLCLLGVVVIGLVGGFTYNYAKGDRGMNAVPGYSLITEKSTPAGYSKSHIKP